MIYLILILSQFSFIYFRTLNIRFTAAGNVAGSLTTGAVVSVLFFFTTFLGVDAIQKHNWFELAANVAGGMIGAYYGMIKKMAR